MPYVTEISRDNPTCFLFLVDQSASMLEPFGGQPERQKAKGVADALNRLLQNLVLKCAKADGIRDFFHVDVIGCGGRVVSAFAGALAGQKLVPVSQLANNPLRCALIVTRSRSSVQPSTPDLSSRPEQVKDGEDLSSIKSPPSKQQSPEAGDQTEQEESGR